MQPKHQRFLLVSVGLLFLAGAIGLILLNFNKNIVFFYSPTEFLTLSPAEQHKPVRVGGLVKKGSILKEPETLKLHFVLTDLSKEMTVYYEGLLPALFREEQGMVAKGTLQPDGTFLADELLAKHDEKYMPPEVVKILKNKGEWKPAQAK